jgi:hypothetical protein
VYGKTVVEANDKPLLEGWSDTESKVIVGKDEQQPTTHVRVKAEFKFKPIFSKIPTFGFGQDIVLGMTFQASVTMRAL